MPASEDLVPAPPPPWFWRLLAGIDTGALAACMVLFWFAVHSRLLREPWWAKFNLAAAPLFGDRIFFMGPGRATVAGAALLFLLYTVLGVVFAFLAGNRGRWRTLALALLWMTCWHLFAHRYVWTRLDPSAAPYFLWPATAPAHAAAAILLMRLPARLRRFQALVQTPKAPPLPPAAPNPAEFAPAPPGRPKDATGSAAQDSPEPRPPSPLDC